jgi:F0F1-type ATP synthase assembly protein I
MTPDDTRNWHQAEDETWSRAMELALTPVVAGGIGYVLDRILGTVPLFTIAFLLLAVIATFIKMYYAYDAKMKAHDAESPWGRAKAHATARATIPATATAITTTTATATTRAPASATAERGPAKP